jgi:mannose-6-phosphate isomerase-like protein (cupin superfamily)
LPELLDYPEGPRPDRQPNIPRVEDGTGMVWTAKDMNHAFDGADKKVHVAGAYAGTKDYRIYVNQRPPKSDGDADAEMHQNMAQIYIVLSGTATQYLGGTPDKSIPFPNGNFAAKGILKGGKKYRVGPGDMLLIPPGTWHATVPDSGQTFNYNMVNVWTTRPDGSKP